jgi:hypothetical protein
MTFGKEKIGNVIGLPGGGNLRLSAAADQMDPAAVREMVYGEVSDGGEDVFFAEDLAKVYRDGPREMDDALQVFACCSRRRLDLGAVPFQPGRFFWEYDLHRAPILIAPLRASGQCHNYAD